VYQQVSSPKPSTMKCYNVKLSLTFVPAWKWSSKHIDPSRFILK
jgi:hypothetical protein